MGVVIKLIISLAILLISLTIHSEEKTILFIGDSQAVGPFGKKLDSLLRKKQYQIATYASCGSTLKYWETGKETTCGFFYKDLKGNFLEAKRAFTPKIQELMKTLKPQILILEFGGNYAAYKDDQMVKAEITRFLTDIKKQVAKCIWITHPNARNNSERRAQLWKVLEETVSPYCEVFKSQLVTTYPETGGDGTHYSFGAGIAIAEKWATSVVEKFF